MVNFVELRAEQRKQSNTLRRIEARLETSAGKETQMTAAVDAIRTEVASLRTTQTEIADAITALAGRLSDNPSETEVAAVAAELSEVAASFSGFNESLDSLDPAVAGGAVSETPAEAPPEG